MYYEIKARKKLYMSPLKCFDFQAPQNVYLLCYINLLKAIEKPCGIYSNGIYSSVITWSCSDKPRKPLNNHEKAKSGPSVFCS